MVHISVIMTLATTFSLCLVDDKVMPIWNTMAAIPGHIKGETVLIGCHRDGESSYWL